MSFSDTIAHWSDVRNKILMVWGGLQAFKNNRRTSLLVFLFGNEDVAKTIKTGQDWTANPRTHVRLHRPNYSWLAGRCESFQMMPWMQPQPSNILALQTVRTLFQAFFLHRLLQWIVGAVFVCATSFPRGCFFKAIIKRIGSVFLFLKLR